LFGLLFWLVSLLKN
jgi:hypothetical protein